MINKFFILFIFFIHYSVAKDVDNLLNNIVNDSLVNSEKNLIKNQPTDRFTDYVKIQALNKLTGESVVINIKIGTGVRFGDLEIYAIKCWKSYPEEKIENKLLLKVIEKKRKSLKKEEIFYGWFFSSTPSVSTLEHELYDIKLLNCYNLEKKDENN